MKSSDKENLIEMGYAFLWVIGYFLAIAACAIMLGFFIEVFHKLDILFGITLALVMVGGSLALILGFAESAGKSKEDDGFDGESQ